MLKVLVARSYLTLSGPMACSLPGSSPMKFSRQEYWSELPFPSPGDLPHPGIEPSSLSLQADSLPPEPPGKHKTCSPCPREAYSLGKLTSDLVSLA